MPKKLTANMPTPSNSASCLSFYAQSIRDWFGCSSRKKKERSDSTDSTATTTSQLGRTLLEDYKDLESAAPKEDSSPQSTVAISVKSAIYQEQTESFCSKAKSYLGKNCWLVLPVITVGFSYVCQNREGLEKFDASKWYYAGLIGITGIVSCFINGGLYEIVFKKLPHMLPQLTEYWNDTWHIKNPVGVAVASIILTTLSFAASMPLVAATLTGAKLLGLPDIFVLPACWVMGIARAIAVTQGAVGLPKAIQLLKNKMKSANPTGKKWIKRILVGDIISATFYVLMQRMSISVALGSHEIMPAFIADNVQKMPVLGQIALQILPTLANLSFYAFWITLGDICVVEPIWNKNLPKHTKTRAAAMVLSLLSMAASAAPLFSGDKSDPTKWEPEGTTLPFEANQVYMLTAGIFAMSRAWPMNVRSLLQNFGVLQDAQDEAQNKPYQQVENAEEDFDPARASMVSQEDNERFSLPDLRHDNGRLTPTNLDLPLGEPQEALPDHLRRPTATLTPVSSPFQIPRNGAQGSFTAAAGHASVGYYDEVKDYEDVDDTRSYQPPQPTLRQAPETDSKLFIGADPTLSSASIGSPYSSGGASPFFEIPVPPVTPQSAPDSSLA